MIPALEALGHRGAPGSEGEVPPERIAAQILLDLGLSSNRLLTNNPRKIVGLEGYGLRVTGRVPLEVDPSDFNEHYLDTKRAKLGHLL